MEPPLRRYAILVPDVGFTCGYCCSADDWIETQTDVGCTNCGTLLPHDQLDDYYDYAEQI